MKIVNCNTRALNYIICEDNPHFLKKIEDIVNNYNLKRNVNAKVHSFLDYDKDFFEVMNENLTNKIYILDVEMPSYSGIDIARKIRNFDHSSIIILISTHSDLAVNVAFDLLHILTFIPKLNDCFYHLQIALEKSHEIIGEESNFKVKMKDTIYYINYKDILYITYDSLKHKSVVVTDSKNYYISMSLKDCFSKLNYQFRYSHRSCIVNMGRVKANKVDKIIFDNDKTIPFISDMFYK